MIRQRYLVESNFAKSRFQNQRARTPVRTEPVTSEAAPAYITTEAYDRERSLTPGRYEAQSAVHAPIDFPYPFS